VGPLGAPAGCVTKFTKHSSEVNSILSTETSMESGISGYGSVHPKPKTPAFMLFRTRQDQFNS